LTNTPIVINEANTLSASIKRYYFSSFRKKLICTLYPKSLIITTVSEYVKSDLIRNFKLNKDKIITVHSGINIKAVEKLSKKYNMENKNYILACGGLHWRKNHNLLIEAAEQLKNTPLIILGTGKLKESLAAKAKTLGVNLILPGYLENPYPYFKNAMFFVLTSFYEGFPNVLLDAIALKTPVISVDCPGGIREIINNGETGVIVKRNDKQALANAMQSLTENPDMRKKLAQNAYENLTKKFTLERMVREYEKVLYL
ncbi:MAG: glycosyltransferase, partial [Elusimicrobiales bacterium]|nr:glycosyltransferase [Elusimicrobiales bacterium]